MRGGISLPGVVLNDNRKLENKRSAEVFPRGEGILGAGSVVARKEGQGAGVPLSKTGVPRGVMYWREGGCK